MCAALVADRILILDGVHTIVESKSVSSIDSSTEWTSFTVWSRSHNSQRHFSRLPMTSGKELQSRSINLKRESLRNRSADVVNDLDSDAFGLGGRRSPTENPARRIDRGPTASVRSVRGNRPYVRRLAASSTDGS